MKGDRHVRAYRCVSGCIWMHDHGKCPRCGGALSPARIGSGARIVSHTVVRVNPTGSPIHLGVARTDSGATTLCVIHGDIRGNGRDRVRLVVRDGRYHALARRARVCASDGDGYRRR